jgi:hypothetical protein
MNSGVVIGMIMKQVFSVAISLPPTIAPKQRVIITLDYIQQEAERQ